MKNTLKIALIGAVLFFFESSFSFSIAQPINNSVQLTQNYLHIRFMCEPCIASSTPVYENYGFKGSGRTNEIWFEKGRFVSHEHRSSTPSNGWYDYKVTSHYTNAYYSDTIAMISCEWLSYGTFFSPNGDPARSYDGKEQEIKKGTEKFELFTKTNGRAKCDFEIEYANDSTIIEKHSATYSRTFTITPNHIQIKTSAENDIWNVEMWLESGNPIRIKDYRGERYYRYTVFDDKGNWIKRERINNEGSIVFTETRIIDYN